MFGKEFKVLKELPRIFEHIGDSYPEYFRAYEEDGKLNYYILDDNFGMPSPANYCDTQYAKDLRKKCDMYLIALVEHGYVQEVDDR